MKHTPKPGEFITGVVLGLAVTAGLLIGFALGYAGNHCRHSYVAELRDSAGRLTGIWLAQRATLYGRSAWFSTDTGDVALHTATTETLEIIPIPGE